MKAALLALLLPAALWAEPLTHRALALTTSVTGEELHVNLCTPLTPPEYYDVQVVEFPAKTQQLPTYEMRLAGSADVWNFTPVRAGVYYIRARSCNAAGCSPWSISYEQEDGAAVCSPEPQRLLWYVKLAAPTGGGIE